MARLLPAVERELRDATMRSAERSARVAREKSERLLRWVANSVPDGIVAVGEDGEVLVWNPAARRLLGSEPTDDAECESGDGQARFLAPDGSAPLSTKELPLFRALNGETVEGHEVAVTLPGSESPTLLSVNARPMLDTDGVSRGAVAVLRDITRERDVQQQLAVADRMASIGMLAAGVAHEINNPLASLVVNVDLALESLQKLAQQFPKSRELLELREELEDAREASRRMCKIVHDVKVFCRSDPEEPSAVDLSIVLESAIRMAWNQIRHRAELVRSYGAVPTVHASESRLGQVFLNLLVNAAQAIPEGRVHENRITVSTEVAPDGRVAIEIRDTGPGISPGSMQKLFTPLFTTKPKGVGTGLGLAICLRIVDALGGEIQVKSKVGAGTTFRVMLPSSDMAASQPDTAGVESPSAEPCGALRILAVDDETLVTDALRRLLGRQHEFTSENGARAALERISRGEHFDVILCDFMMPNMSGADLFEELERIAPDQARKVVFLTGGTVSSRADAIQTSRPNRWLGKPFEPEKLRALLSSLQR
jgi:PAS domain S-box-containing protein